MESSSKASFASRFPVLKKIDVDSLRKCAALMGPVEVISFDQSYGNIRRLLQLKVQEDALVALSQFYDSDMRCFFFKNFQLSPTLEEYEQLLGLSKSHIKPYQFPGQYYTDEKLAMLLRIGVDKLKPQKLERNGIAGYPQEFFEGLLQSYALAENWGLFKLVLALTIFGVVLFPQLERYVDEDAIGAFLAFKDTKNPINPVPAVLANTYHALTRYDQFRKKKICLPSHVLYAWLITHVVQNRTNVKELISYALSCDVEVRTSLEWVEFLRSLDDLQIRWYTPACWDDRPMVIFSCGTFQNVPLMGTQGCINYNPSLIIRQLGYPMRNSPSEDMLSHVYLYKGMPRCDDLLRKVQQSWGSVVRKGVEELSKKTNDITFNQWLKEKLQTTKSLSQGALPLEEEIPEPYTPTHEELNEVKSALAKVEDEKKALQARIEEMALEKERLEEESVVRRSAMEKSVRKFEEEKQSRVETQKRLKEAREELQKYKQKTRKTLEEAQGWKAKAMEASQESHLVGELRGQLRILGQERIAIEKMLREYQQALKVERGMTDGLKRDLYHLEDAYRQVRVESQYWERRYLDLLGRIEDQEIIKEFRDEIQLWKGKFLKLSELASQAMVGVPKSLRIAEAEMHFFNTPPEVYKFVKYCRALITEFKERSPRANVSKKRKRVGEFKAICI